MCALNPGYYRNPPACPSRGRPGSHTPTPGCLHQGRKRRWTLGQLGRLGAGQRTQTGAADTPWISPPVPSLAAGSPAPLSLLRGPSSAFSCRSHPRFHSRSTCMRQPSSERGSFCRSAGPGHAQERSPCWVPVTAQSTPSPGKGTAETRSCCWRCFYPPGLLPNQCHQLSPATPARL